MNRTTLKRLTVLERQAPRAPDPGTAEVDRWCEAALGCAFDDLETDDLMRIEMLLRDAPEFAHPLLLRACIGRPEDREPPDGEACLLWQRRRWGYVPARDDPEAWAVGQQLESWAVSPDRPYRDGADLRLALHHIGVLPWDGMSLFELRRLVDLCAALDQLAGEDQALRFRLRCGGRCSGGTVARPVWSASDEGTEDPASSADGAPGASREEAPGAGPAPAGEAVAAPHPRSGRNGSPRSRRDPAHAGGRVSRERAPHPLLNEAAVDLACCAAVVRAHQGRDRAATGSSGGTASDLGTRTA